MRRARAAGNRLGGGSTGARRRSGRSTGARREATERHREGRGMSGQTATRCDAGCCGVRGFSGRCDRNGSDNLVWRSVSYAGWDGAGGGIAGDWARK